jgi:BioD-like phosphotransacetylase family protein
MKSVFMGSVVERSGKTMVTLGLAKNYKGKVGYFKPFRETLVYDEEKVIDADTYLMKRALGLPQDVSALSPFVYDVLKPVTMTSILGAYKAVKCDCELMLVEGTRDITTGYLHDISGMAIAEAVKADVVLISTTQPSALDKIAMLVKLMENYRVGFKGVILNFSDSFAPKAILEEKGIKVLGSIPEMPELRHFSAREVGEALSAEIVVEDGLDRTVEQVMVGAMTPETALRTMRRVPRKAIITGGDRADLQMAALSTDTSCLVLTGGMAPSKPVIAKAYETGVPILLTMYDTMEAAETVEHLIARIDPADTGKIERITKAVRENVDLEAVWGG